MALTRSEIMSRIRSSGTKPEVSVQQALSAARMPHRRNFRGLPGTPDAWIEGRRWAVFVDGCFWHGARCCYREPKSNVAFWREKIRRNRARDRRVDRELRAMGIHPIRVKECEIRRRGPWPAFLLALSPLNKRLT